jgi:hypothetical protein
MLLTVDVVMLLTVDAAFAIKRHHWTIRPRCSTVILASGDGLRIELSFVRKPIHYFDFVLCTDRLASGEMKACKELQNFRKVRSGQRVARLVVLHISDFSAKQTMDSCAHREALHESGNE